MSESNGSPARVSRDVLIESLIGIILAAITTTYKRQS